MYKKILIGLFVIAMVGWLLQFGYEYFQKPTHYSFLVENKEIGQYNTFEKCVSDEKRYHHLRIYDEFVIEETTCDWR